MMPLWLSIPLACVLLGILVSVLSMLPGQYRDLKRLREIGRRLQDGSK